MEAPISQIGALLFVSVLVAMIARRLRMPYTTGLVIAGIGLSLLPVPLSLHLSRDLIFSVFLPPLVFEAALYIRWTDLRRDLPVVALLATVGVLVATAITASGMNVLLGWPWSSAIIFGILISATDPVSVIATFKEAGVHGRLRLLVEAESLLNDGTAAVAVSIALGVVAGDRTTLSSLVQSATITIGGGVICGLAAGWSLMLLAGRSTDRLVKFTLTSLAAYGSFFIAERLHVSGVLAALAAGMVTGNLASKRGESGADWGTVEAFWDYAAFVANSLIFLLIGSQVAQQRFEGIWPMALVAIGLVTLGRAMAIYPLCAMFVRTRLRVDARHQHVLFWGGLRGALALALALGLPEDFPYHQQILSASFAVVAFSIFVQGLTMTPLLRRLGQIGGSAAP